MPRFICENCHLTTTAPDWKRPASHHQRPAVTVPICPHCHSELEQTLVGTAR